ncbi:Amino acid transporter [Macleaya cordata]|uniref:Amino acid transporter n=1 Tax=Macleaya cordata TaxID=56857 RepID=A0A200Q3J2_MACCD|nr:Amino acid transporter [Macleaya cordata]
MVSQSPLPHPKDEVCTDEKAWSKDGEDGDGPPRQAKWWYSAFHTVTAMVGAGVLSLPYAMAYLGWGPGTLVLVLSWCITLFTIWQMIQLHELVPGGTRFDRYYELGQHAFGPKLGPWVVLPQQLIVQIGCDIVYMVTGGKCLKKFMEIACTDCTRLKQSYWICIFGSIHFFLSQLPNFNSVAGVSLAAAIMSLSYSTISWVGCLSRGQIENVSYAYKKTTSADYMFRVFNALGEISFAFAGHAVVLEIQATIPSTPSKPSKIPMWRGARTAYFITAICYFPVAMIGYWAFGNVVEDNLLLALKRPEWLIAAANLMVVIHVIGSYQVYAMPVFDMLENLMVKRFKFPRGFPLRLITRSTYVALTLFVGVTFPFFGDLLGFFGGFGFAPTSYFLPCIMWLAIKKPRRFSRSWFINWACIFVGMFIMFASTIGGLRNIIIDASTYSFYT